MEDHIRVVVRCRPLNMAEQQESTEVVSVNEERADISIQAAQGAPRRFTFDAVYGPNSTNQQIYQETVSQLIVDSVNGYNVCIMAYGQTGAGKTYTISGICQMVGESLFDNIILQQEQSNVQFLVSLQVIEIYCEELRDLLNTSTTNLPLKIIENKQTNTTKILNSTVLTINSPQEFINVVIQALSTRTTASTRSNAVSSRSHCIIRINIERVDLVQQNTGDYQQQEQIKAGRIDLVDLAGSERVDKTGAEGQRLREAGQINKSLSALCGVIQALVDNSQFVPYRDSVLTKILRDSLGGNAKTLLIANISPAQINCSESLSTLRYANQAKRIVNKPVINENPKDARLKALRDRIAQLEAELAQREGNDGVYLSPEDQNNILNAFNQGGNNAQKLANYNNYENEDSQSLQEVLDPEEAALAEKQRIARARNISLEAQIKYEEESAAACRIQLEEMRKDLQVLKGLVVQNQQLKQENAAKTAAIRVAKERLAARAARGDALRRALIAKEEEEREQELLQQDIVTQLQQYKNIIKQKQQQFEIMKQDSEAQLNQHKAQCASLMSTLNRALRKTELLDKIADIYIPPRDYEKALDYAVFNSEETRFQVGDVPMAKSLLANARAAAVVQYPRMNKIGHLQNDEVFIKASTFLQKDPPELQTDPGDGDIPTIPSDFAELTGETRYPQNTQQ